MILIIENRISKSSGAGVKLFNVRGPSKNQTKHFKDEVPATSSQASDFFQQIIGDPSKVLLEDNVISDFTQGIGIILDQTTAHVKKCIIRGNPSGGVEVKSSKIKNYIEITEFASEYAKT